MPRLRLVWVTLNILLRFLDSMTATSTDTRIVSMIATKIANTTAAITLTEVPPPLPLSSMETISPGVESVGKVLSLGVEESDTIMVVDEAMSVDIESLVMGSKFVGSSEVGSGDSALVSCSSVVGSFIVGSSVVASGVVGSAVVGSSVAIVVVGGGVIGHGGGVGKIRGQSDVSITKSDC